MAARNGWTSSNVATDRNKTLWEAREAKEMDATTIPMFLGWM